MDSTYYGNSFGVLKSIKIQNIPKVVDLKCENYNPDKQRVNVENVNFKYNLELLKKIETKLYSENTLVIDYHDDDEQVRDNVCILNSD